MLHRLGAMPFSAFFVAAFHVPFLFGCFLFVIAPLIALSIYLEKKRTAALRDAAAELRLEFFPKGGPLSLTEMSGFYLMQHGSSLSRKFKNLMHGNAQGIDVSIFDYQYDESSGESSSTRYTTVARFRSPELRLPLFCLRPAGLFHKIGQALGFKDIDFPAYPTFSKTFLLRGPGESTIRMLFDDGLIISLQPMRGISVEGKGDELIFYRYNQRVKPDAVRAFFEEAFTIFSRFADASKRRKR